MQDSNILASQWENPAEPGWSPGKLNRITKPDCPGEPSWWVVECWPAPKLHTRGTKGATAFSYLWWVLRGEVPRWKALRSMTMVVVKDINLAPQATSLSVCNGKGGYASLRCIILNWLQFWEGCSQVWVDSSVCRCSVCSRAALLNLGFLISEVLWSPIYVNLALPGLYIKKNQEVAI